MATATKRPAARKEKATKRLTPEMRLAELKAFISLVFAMTSDITHAELAERSTISLNTIYRLFHGDFTLAMRVNTLQCLAYAAGMELHITDSDVRVTLVKPRKE